MHNVDPRQALEQLTVQMEHRAIARRGKIQCARFLPSQCNQLLHGCSLHRGMHRQYVGALRDQIDRRKICHHVVRQFALIVRQNRQRRRHAEKQRVAIGHRARRQLRGNYATGAAAIIDHDLLLQLLTDTLKRYSRHGVDTTARRKRHQQADGFRGVGLRAGHAAKQGCCHQQMALA